MKIDLASWIVSGTIFCVILISIVLVIVALSPAINPPDYWAEYMVDTYVKCCNNSYCSDTYYDETKDLCVLTLCRNSIFTKKEDCYYKPK